MERNIFSINYSLKNVKSHSVLRKSFELAFFFCFINIFSMINNVARYDIILEGCLRRRRQKNNMTLIGNISNTKF